MEYEFQSFFTELGPIATAGFKFFNSFKIKTEEGIIAFYKDFQVALEQDTLKDLRVYIKEEKTRLIEGKKRITRDSVRQRVIFFIVKLHELHVFTFSDRKYLFFYWQTLDDLLI